jgi:hypothetical protein
LLERRFASPNSGRGAWFVQGSSFRQVKIANDAWMSAGFGNGKRRIAALNNIFLALDLTSNRLIISMK